MLAASSAMKTRQLRYDEIRGYPASAAALLCTVTIACCASCQTIRSYVRPSPHDLLHRDCRYELVRTGLTFATPLPNATESLGHYFRTTICLSAERLGWLRRSSEGRTLTMKVFANNGADVFVNGAKLVASSALNRRAIYWNDQVSVPPATWVPGGKAAGCDGYTCDLYTITNVACCC
jgi:hypothetical protein